MSNKVSFIIELRDKFRAIGKKIDAQFESIKRNADKASVSVKNFARKAKSSLEDMRKQAALAGAALTASVTVPLGFLSKQMIDSASDAEETANKFKEVFKGIDSQSSAAVQSLQKDFKLASSTAQVLLSDTGDLLVGLGLTREKALELSKQVVSLSADVASFKNVQGGTERASIALTKALLGEREMLKETFKTAVLEEEVKKRAAIIRFKDRKLTEQQSKALATLAIVTERNKDAIGDFARTQTGYANLARISAEKSKQLSETFGKILLPIAIKIQLAFIDIATWVEQLNPRAKQLIVIIAALAAVAGPLLLLLAGIGAAAAVVTVGMLAIGGAVAALAVAGAMLFLNWEEIVAGGKALWSDFVKFMGSVADSIAGSFTSMWEGIKTGLIAFVNQGIAMINSLLEPLNLVAEKLGLDTVSISQVQSPSAPPVQAGGNVEGNITVAAEKGSSVRDIRMRNRGRNLNIGMNMATP